LTVLSSAGDHPPAAIAVLAAGGAMLAAFLWVERRKGDTAMMPLALFQSSTFVGLTMLTLLLYGALGGLLVLVPYVLIEANDYSATEAGAALLPLPLVLALTSSAMGKLAGRIGSRLPLTIGPLVVAVGFALATRMDIHGNYWTTTLPAILVISLGMAGAVAPLTTAVLASVDARHTGVASGLNSAVARTGGLVATALVSAVLAAHGAPLIALFHRAAWTGAAVSAAAGLSAFVWVRQEKSAAQGGRA
jgi:predicted MFS family arabinose efflux permease